MEHISKGKSYYVPTEYNLILFNFSIKAELEDGGLVVWFALWTDQTTLFVVFNFQELDILFLFILVTLH